MTISQIFHVRSGDLSSNTLAATINLIAAAQMLHWLVIMNKQGWNTTHKKPNVNMIMMPHFCSKGSCSCEICHIGKIKIAISMAA